MLEAAQWPTPTPARAEPRDLLGVEMDAMREPRAPRHPARLLEQIDWPQAIHFQAEALLVLGLAEMRVQLAIVALRQRRAVAHQPLVDRERRARRERDANLRRRAWDHGTASTRARCPPGSRPRPAPTLSGGRPPSFWLRFIEPRVTVMRMPISRAASTSMSTASSSPGGKKIMMIGRRRAARQHQLGEREPRRQTADGSASAAPRSDKARRARETTPC